MKNQENENPMSSDEVKKLKTVKSNVTEEFNIGHRSLLDETETEMIDGYLFPTGTTTKSVPKLKKGAKVSVNKTDTYCPKHADIDYTPNVSAKNEKPLFIDRNAFINPVGTKTLFGINKRTVYYSKAYPWRCVGKIETALGSGSGVMIGPRHVLTCCHVIDFKSNGSTGWIKFTPMYYDGGTPPYGSAYGIKTYYKYKVSGPTLDAKESQYDYAVIVLDKEIGKSTGWMGAKAYSDSWDGKALWTHAGYPGDITGGQRPIYVTDISLDGDNFTTDNHQAIYHQGDVWPGQSGGPFWGYWNGVPYVVAVQSGETPANNSASGGSDLLDLVNKARAEYP